MFGLSNDYLNELSRFCLPNFKKVIPCDYIHRYKLKPGNQFIINLSHSSTLGSHFVAISIRENHCIYFDSFGLECTNSYITKQMKKCKKKIVHSKKTNTRDFKSFLWFLLFGVFDSRYKRNNTQQIYELF